MGSNESAPLLDSSETELSLQGEGLQLIPFNIPPSHPVKTLLLSHNSLALIPQMLLHLENLDISYNDLGKLCVATAILDFPELKYFCFSGNSMRAIPVDLGQYKELTDITADRNKFSDSEKSFADVKKLENLDLTLNLYTIIPHLPETLVSLNISFNYVQEVNMKDLPNLRELRLSGNDIRMISDDCYLPSLKNLDLSMNSITRIPEVSKFAPTLENLQISFNLLEEFPKCLPSTIIKIDVSHNRIKTWDEDLNDKVLLTNLDVSHNKITNIPLLPEQLDNFNADNNLISSSQEIKTTKMQTIQLNYNCFGDIPLVSQCQALTLNMTHSKLTKIIPTNLSSTITRMDFTSNMITEIPVEIFMIEKLQTLNVTNNQITSLPNSIATSSITNLYISQNNISSFPALPASLMTIEAISCSFTEFPDQLADLTRLSYVDFSNNKISVIKRLPTARHLGLSCNLITSVPEIPDNTTFLDLSFNQLKEVKIIADFMMLQELDISHNQIETFVFKNLQIVNTLKLSHNPMSKFTLDFKKLPSLKTCDATMTKMKIPPQIPDNLKLLATSDEAFFSQAKTPRVRFYNPKHCGYSDTIGVRPTMEDSMIIRENIFSDVHLYAVIDGHGGSDTACLSSYLIPQYFAAEKSKSISTFSNIITKLSDRLKKANVRDGATIAITFVTPFEISCAYLGDSRALIVSSNGKITPLTYDHKPTEPAEITFIKEKGSYVSDKRTAGILAISRAIGDLNIEGVSHIPDFTIHFRKATDFRLVLACDGVFDVLSSGEVAQIVLNTPDVNQAAATIRNIALSRLTQDNISVIVVNIELKSQ